MMENGSVSVRFPASYRGVYTEHQYTYIAGESARLPNLCSLIINIP